MPISPSILNPDGTLKAFTLAQVAAFGMDTRGIRADGFPHRQGDQTQETLNHKCYVVPSTIDDAVCFILGAAVNYTSSLDGLEHLSRLMPAPYPFKPWLRGAALTTDVGFKFVVESGGGSFFNTATYAQQDTEWLFQTLPFELATDAEVAAANNYEGIRYVQTLPTQQFSEYLTLPGLGLKYAKNGGGLPTGLSVGFNTGFPILSSIVTRKWYRIPKICWGKGSELYTKLFGNPDAEVIGLVGTINRYPILGYPAGTMLLLPPEEEVVFDQASSEYCFNITYKWKYQPQGHNFLLYPGTSQGFYFVTKETPPVFYPTSTLPDGISIFNARDHTGEFVGTYTGVFSVGPD